MLRMSLWILVILLLACCSALQLSWDPTPRNQDCPQCKHFTKVGANFSSVLLVDNKLVIGAKNSLYYLDFGQETVEYFPDETVPPDGYDTCIKDYGQSSDDCQNYYKVIMKIRNNDLFICGTDAFKPSCHFRTLDDLSYHTNTLDVPGICPASPSAPTSYIKIKDLANVGFAATAVGTGGEEHAVQRIELKYGSFGISCRTKSDNFWLNAPDFVYTFEDGDFVYVVFKEIAAEKYPERVYSRIARICKTDEGSQNPFFKDNFLTFVKARIYCPYSQDGAAPYTFDAISGAYFLDGTLYGLFTGSNSIVETGSVLCKFSMSDIDKAFRGDYKSFRAGSWVNTKNPTPFTCNTTRTVFDVTKGGVLMADSVEAERVLLYSSLELTSITADMLEMNGNTFTTLHAGSSNGKVLRIGVSTDEYGEIKVTKTRISDTGSRIITELISDDRETGAVYAMTPDYITHIPLDSDCSIYDTCQTCQDAYPGCGWCYDPVHKSGKCDKTASCHIDSERFYGPFASCPALPEFAQQPQDVEIDLNMGTKLQCMEKDGDLAVEKYWQKDQGALPFNSVVTTDGALIISNADGKDNTCYTCVLQGVSGSVSARACVFVRIPPSIITTPEHSTSYSVSGGKDVVMTCRATGNPAPKYNWFKVDGKLPEGYSISVEGDLKLIRVNNQDAGTYRCRVTNIVGSVISDEISLRVKGTGHEPNSIKGNDNFDLTIIIVAVASAIIVIVVVVALVHLFYKRNQTKKGSPGYSTVPEDERNVLPRFGGSQPVLHPRVPTSSLPTNLQSELLQYNQAACNWPPQSSTIANPPGQHNGSPGFPGNLVDYGEQPPPPYQPTLIAAHLLSEHQNMALQPHQEHQYDEINILMAQQQHPQDILTVNGYNSTFRLNNGQIGRTTPPTLIEQHRRTSGPSSDRHTPPQIPERCNQGSYEVVRRDSPAHRLTPEHHSPGSHMSPGSHVSHSSHVPSPPWGQNSDI